QSPHKLLDAIYLRSMRKMDETAEPARSGCDCECIPAAQEHGTHAGLPVPWPTVRPARCGMAEQRLIIAVRNWLAHKHRTKERMMDDLAPIRGDEMPALRKLRRDYPKDAYVFVSERGGPMGPIGFHRLIQRVGEAAKMQFPIHPHMLRHACGSPSA